MADLSHTGRFHGRVLQVSQAEKAGMISKAGPTNSTLGRKDPCEEDSSNPSVEDPYVSVNDVETGSIG